MPKYSIDETTLTGIAGAIRTKKGYTSLQTMTPAQMIEEINSISGLEVGDDFFLLAENLGTSVSEIMTMDLPAGGQIRLTGFNWTVPDYATVKNFFDRLDSMHGIDANGQEVNSCADCIIGLITIDELSNYAFTHGFQTISNTYSHVVFLVNHHIADEPLVLNYYSDDGSILYYSETVNPGNDGTYSEIPVKESSPEFSYQFSGWALRPGGSVDSDALTGLEVDRNVYAVFTTTPRTYSVSFYNYAQTGGSFIATVNNVSYGTSVASLYTGSTPEFVLDGGDGYAFTGWDVDIVTGPTVTFPVYTLSSGITSKYISEGLKIAFGSATAVGDHAFFGLSTILRGAYFPNAEYIGEWAFWGCSQMVRAAFPEVSNLGAYAFANCSNLSYIALPKLKMIGESAFTRCNYLRDISFPEVDTISADAFYSCGLRSAILPKATSIGNSAFYSCNVLSTVEAPLLTTIEARAFYSCVQLSNISFPLVTTIGSSAFQNCRAMVSVSFPLVTSMGESVFASCSLLSDVSFPKLIEIPNYAFANLSMLTNVSFPEVETIQTGAFNNCKSLVDVSFPKLKTLGPSVFGGCTSLSTIQLPLMEKGLLSTYKIPDYTFANCSNLVSVSFYSVYLGNPQPGNVYIRDVGVGAFRNCSSLSVFPFNYVTTIGASAFEGCKSLTSVILSSVTSIGNYAFSNCSFLTTVSFSALNYLGVSAFANCYNLSIVNVQANNGAKIETGCFFRCSALTTTPMIYTSYIGNSAFYGCVSLEEVNFYSARTIGTNAFDGCTSLRIGSFSRAFEIYTSAFRSCTALISVSSPMTVSIGSAAFLNCSSLLSVSFPAALSLGSYAFSGCTSLSTVTFPALQTIGFGAFLSCRSLKNASFPEVTMISDRAFESCLSLSTIRFDKVLDIMGSSAFKGCSLLESVYILTSEVCCLSSAFNSVFMSTPLVNANYLGHYGSIFVPESLVNEYKTADKWSAYDLRIAAYSGG